MDANQDLMVAKQIKMLRNPTDKLNGLQEKVDEQTHPILRQDSRGAGSAIVMPCVSVVIAGMCLLWLSTSTDPLLGAQGADCGFAEQGR